MRNIKFDFPDDIKNDEDLYYQLIIHHILSHYDEPHAAELKALIVSDETDRFPTDAAPAFITFFLQDLESKLAINTILLNLCKKDLAKTITQIKHSTGYTVNFNEEQFTKWLKNELLNSVGLLENIRTRIRHHHKALDTTSEITITVASGGLLTVKSQNSKTGLISKLNLAWADTFADTFDDPTDIGRFLFLGSAWDRVAFYLGVPRDDYNGNYAVKWAAYLLGGFIITPVMHILRLPFEILPYSIECVLRHWQERTTNRLASALLTGAIGIAVGIRLMARAVLSPIKSIRRALQIDNPWLSTAAVALSIVISAAAIAALAMFVAPKVAIKSLPILITLTAIGIQVFATPLQKIIPRQNNKATLLDTTVIDPYTGDERKADSLPRKTGKRSWNPFAPEKIDLGLEAQISQAKSNVVTPVGTPSTSKNNSLERSDKKSPAHSSTYETDLDHPSQDGQRGRSNDTTKSDRSPLIITENVSATPKKGRFGVVRKIFGQTLTGEHNLHHPNMIRHSNTQGAAPRPGSLHGDT